MEACNIFSDKKYLLDNFLPNRSLCSLRTHDKEMTEWWESSKANGCLKSESNGGFSNCPKKCAKTYFELSHWPAPPRKN